MKTICAWCGATIRNAQDHAPDEEPVSHGICLGCLDSIGMNVVGGGLEELRAAIDDRLRLIPFERH